ncbi:MAG: hypothetical protein K0U98_09080 [Deltaproteobacteria bacterium]|nr:hypothetical protein [Deltaproteobacteria bacterium]
MKKLYTAIRTTLVIGAHLGLLARAFVPAGFMISSFEDGWPVKLCPGQNQGVLATAYHLEDGPKPDSSPASDPDRTHDTPHCVLGVSFSLSAEVESQDFAIRLQRVEHRALELAESGTSSEYVDSERSRGPPSPRFFRT